MRSIKSLRTAVIGVGNMGKNHARVYAGISTLCAVVDSNAGMSKDAAKKFGAHAYTNVSEMLDKEHPDAVSVVVPTQFHKDVVIKCLALKIPTLVEKPIASTITEARKMQQSSKLYNTYLLTGHIERFNPVVIQLKKIIERGEIGKIISLLTMRVGISPPHIPHSNVLLDLGIHDVDVCNYLLGEYPRKQYTVRRKVFKHTDVDFATVNLEYSSCNAVIMTNWITPIKIRRLYLTCTEGFIDLDYINQRIYRYGKIMNTSADGNFLKFISLSQSPKKQLLTSKREPLKEELTYFLKRRTYGSDSQEIESSIRALQIVLG